MSSECRLHVYDVTNSPNENANIAVSRFNNVTRYVAVGGIFHGGIEVYGDEWSYGYTTRDSGVYMCQPKDNPMYTYRETISLGKTHFSRQEVAQIIQLLKMAWRGEAYDTMTCNCNHFCAELAKRLEVDPLPGWLNRMATGAEAIYSFSNYTAEQARLAKEGTLSWWNWATGHAEAQTQQPNKSPKT